MPRPTPLTSGTATILLLLACRLEAAMPPYPFQVETIKDGMGDRLVAHNRGAIPIEIKVWLTAMQNAETDRPAPIDTVVPAFGALDLLGIHADDPARRYTFRYRYRIQIGDPAARPDPNALYRAPFADGLAFRIGQAFGGRLSTHDSDAQRYAVDIPMPEGTTIVAARAGYIVEVERKFDAGKLDPEYTWKANTVTIFHDDGTWASYVHLLRYTSNVVPGQRVEAGTPLGLSGNSGYSSGPHLHFVVQRNSGNGPVSIPIRFETRRRGTFEPRPGDMLDTDRAKSGDAVARSPGGPGTAAGVRSETTSAAPVRSLRECMAGRHEVDRAVLACAGIR